MQHPQFGEGLKRKDLVGIPWRVALALQADGWWLRDAIVWHKPSVTPESVKDRCTQSYEMVFLLARSATYYFDADAIREPAVWDKTPGATRHPGNVWTIPTQPFAGAHFATMPPKLAERCILAGSRTGDVVLDPFCGAATTALVANRLDRDAVGCELNPAYAELSRVRLEAEGFGCLLVDDAWMEGFRAAA